MQQMRPNLSRRAGCLAGGCLIFQTCKMHRPFPRRIGGKWSAISDGLAAQLAAIVRIFRCCSSLDRLRWSRPVMGGAEQSTPFESLVANISSSSHSQNSRCRRVADCLASNQPKVTCRDSTDSSRHVQTSRRRPRRQRPQRPSHGSLDFPTTKVAGDALSGHGRANLMRDLRASQLELGKRLEPRSLFCSGPQIVANKDNSGPHVVLPVLAKPQRH